ncbi:MFS transporter [Haloarcula sediminis]|uniref:MFS transporter n=1 Tax=Haloarcula sediminis TaxID=3111777 RepID=UPI002D79AD1B|nr:MFS transporter [Haloarcula sp. CK38]
MVSQSRLVVGLVGGSHLVNHAYFMLLPPVFGPLRAELGLTDAQLGVALGTVGVVVTALQLPLGSLSDSRGRTPVLAISLIFGALGAVLTATAQSYAWLLGASVVTGVGIAGHHPAHYPLIGAATTADTRGRAYSVHGFTGALGFAAPPAVVAAAATVGLDWRLAIGAIAAVGAVYGAACLLAFDRYVDRDITHPTSDADPAGRPEATGRSSPAPGGSSGAWSPRRQSSRSPSCGFSRRRRAGVSSSTRRRCSRLATGSRTPPRTSPSRPCSPSAPSSYSAGAT